MNTIKYKLFSPSSRVQQCVANRQDQQQMHALQTRSKPNNRETKSSSNPFLWLDVDDFSIESAENDAEHEQDEIN